MVVICMGRKCFVGESDDVMVNGSKTHRMCVLTIKTPHIRA